MTQRISPRRRREVIDALRRGTVPSHGLDLLAVGLDRFTPAPEGELDTVAGGGSVFKAVRGEYGSGKTFFTRHLSEQALRRGFAAAEVQVSETETPLHRLETVYRRITESLRTASAPPSAFRSVLDSCCSPSRKTRWPRTRPWKPIPRGWGRPWVRCSNTAWPG